LKIYFISSTAKSKIFTINYIITLINRDGIIKGSDLAKTAAKVLGCHSPDSICSASVRFNHLICTRKELELAAEEFVHRVAGYGFFIFYFLI
jgi:hypothetical protein